MECNLLAIDCLRIEFGLNAALLHDCHVKWDGSSNNDYLQLLLCVCVIAVWQAKTLQYSIFEQWHCQDCGFARTFAVRLLKLCGNNFRYEIENFAQNCPFMVNAYLIQIGLHRYQAREYRRFWCADADVCSGWAGTGHFYRRWITF